MNKYLHAKIKDLKETLSSDRLNNEIGDSKGYICDEIVDFF